MVQQFLAIFLIVAGFWQPAVAAVSDRSATTIAALPLSGPTSSVAAGSGRILIRELEDSRLKGKEATRFQREAFQVKLNTFTDQAKKERVVSLSARLDDTNVKRTNHLMIFANHIIEVLTKIKIQTEIERAKGKDISKITVAIDAAQTAIDAAKPAIVAQAGKYYIISISSEANVKNDIIASTASLQADAGVVFEMVNAAKKRVNDAIMALAQERGEEISFPTPSVTGAGGGVR